MKFKTHLITALACVMVIGTGFAAWNFGSQTSDSENISVSIAGYTTVGTVEILDKASISYMMAPTAESLYFTAKYTKGTNGIDNPVLTYTVTFSGGLEEYMEPVNSSGVWISEVETVVPVKWKAGKNPTNLAEYEALEALYASFSINIQVFANDPGAGPSASPDSISISLPGGAVSSPTIDPLSTSGLEVELAYNGSLDLGSSATLGGSTTDVNQNVVWSSSDPTIASVTGATGIVTGSGKNGSTYIKAMSTSIPGGGPSPVKHAVDVDGRIYETIKITVTNAPLTVKSIEITGDVTVEAESSITLTAIITMSDDTVASPGQAVVWGVTSGGGLFTGTATNDTYLVEATAAGSVVITAAFGGKSDNHAITITAKPVVPVVPTIESIELFFLDNVSPIEINGLIYIAASVMNSDDEDVADEVTINWTVSAGDLYAAIVEDDGDYITVKGLAAGTATIRAEVDGEDLFDTINVVVNAAPAPTIKSVSLFDEEAAPISVSTIEVGAKLYLEARVINSSNEDVTEVQAGNITWVITAPGSTYISIDNIEEICEVTGISAGGPAVLTASCGGQSASISITVVNPTPVYVPSSIIITADPDTHEIGLDGELELTATIFDNNPTPQNVTASNKTQLVWSILSGGSFVDIDAEDDYCFVEALDAGDAVIKVKLGASGPEQTYAISVVAPSSLIKVATFSAAGFTETAGTAFTTTAVALTKMNSGVTPSNFFTDVHESTRVGSGNGTGGGMGAVGGLIKFGSASGTGVLDFSVSQPVSKMVITGIGWNNDELVRATVNSSYTVDFENWVNSGDQDTQEVSFPASSRIHLEITRIRLYTIEFWAVPPYTPEATSVVVDDIAPKTEGVNFDLTAKVYDQMDVHMAGAVVTWAKVSGNGTVSPAGNVTGTTPGTLTVTATSGSVTSEPKVITISAIVHAATITVSTVGAAPLSVKVDETLGFVATVMPLDAIDKTVTWSVDHPEFASINATTGVLTGVSTGTVVVTATSNDVDAVFGVSGSVSVEPAAAVPNPVSFFVMNGVGVNVPFTAAYNTVISTTYNNGGVNAAVGGVGLATDQATYTRVGGKTNNSNQTTSITAVNTRYDEVSANGGGYIYFNLPSGTKTIQKVVIGLLNHDASNPRGTASGWDGLLMEASTVSFTGGENNSGVVEYKWLSRANVIAIGSENQIVFEPSSGNYADWTNVKAIRLLVPVTTTSNSGMSLINIQLWSSSIAVVA